jgi:Holliday junction resolvasome RuvABC endonuclease subunit
MDIKLPLRIFSVDPATTKSGWAVLELISISPLKVRVLKHAQIDGQKLLTKNKEMSKLFQKQFCVLDSLEQEYVYLIDHYKPDIVVSESAFGYTHMSAVIALTLAIDTLRRASKRVRGKDIVLIPPTISKKALTGSGGADKDQMKISLLSSTEVEFEEAPVDISEHEIDAVSHAIGFIKRDITQEIVQISALDKKRQKREKLKQKEKS